MSWVALPEIDKNADELAQRIVSEAPGCLQILGGLSVGKSTLLRRLRKQLASKGMHPLLLAPPAGALDIMSITLTQLASQLYNGDPTGREVSELLRSQTIRTEEKHRVLADWLSRGKDRFVVLCDEPYSWQNYSGNYPGRAENLSSLYRTLLDTDGLRKVVTGHMPERRQATKDFKVPASSSPEHWLTSNKSWGNLLAEYANKLWNELGPDKLKKKTPLVIRLIVGLVALGETPKRLVKLQRKELAEMLWHRSRDDDALTDLCQAWSCLAFVREGFDPALLNVIGAPDETRTAGQLLRHCLLFEEDGQLILHEMLRADAKDSVSSNDRKMIHTKIARNYYLPLFRNASASGSISNILTYEMEAYYHAATSGEVMDDLRPFFAEQLNLLGRYLSEEESRFKDAADVFARAIAWEPKDDYAHHYFAYNLDCLGQRAKEVDKHYREAVGLRNDHPWWWSRLICFLLTRGRIEQAEAAWSDALDSLVGLYYNESAGTQIFRDLHGHVLNNALYFNQLHFAERIINDVPKSILENDPHFRACRRRLQALRLADEGRAVVPLPYLQNGWWTEGPFRLPPRLKAGHELERWFAARVESVSSEQVRLRLAETFAGSASEPEVLIATFSLDQLRGWSLIDLDPHEGDYWEIGVYREGDKEQYRLFVHDQVRFPEADEQLFQIAPNPERYRRGQTC